MFASRILMAISILATAQWVLVCGAAANQRYGSTDADFGSRATARAGLLVAQNGPRGRAISREQRARLEAEIAQLPKVLRARFDGRYRDWKRTFDRPDILVSSSSKAVRNSKEFATLVSLGPRILPLIVDKLLQPDQFFALQVYDALQDRPELREDEHLDLSEQQRALATALRWLSR
jgi:hypothetical protein